ncbi:MAG: NAD(P)H-dependent oxidoreductase [Flavobacteriaceae bacterium]|nr:NAD(P)H-dependent oxidoreductase [Flavobacteriaceae bacterium]|tara:strand:+ start:22075 stop:22707 length:633 start_codon:yes stop_codon:yes gene_type:complete
MQVLESLQWRYAVKKFDENKLVPASKIDVLKEAFNLTASSYGLQPSKLIVIQNKEIQAELVPHSWNQKQVAQASHLLVIAVPKEYATEEVGSYFNRVKEIRNTPDEIIKPFQEFLTNTVDSQSQEELLAWNKNQAYLAMGNLLTVCALEEIDSCPMEGFIPEKYDEVLGLNNQNLTSVLVLPVGYRAEDDFMKDQKKVRRNLEDIIVDIK